MKISGRILFVCSSIQYREDDRNRLRLIFRQPSIKLSILTSFHLSNISLKIQNHMERLMFTLPLVKSPFAIDFLVKNLIRSLKTMLSIMLANSTLCKSTSF